MRNRRSGRRRGTGKASRFIPQPFKRSTPGRTAKDAAGLSFEQLEPRLALAVVISEFLASNDSGIRDFEGDRSDWIELQNTGPATVDVAGWYLTDEALNLAKWEIPTDPSTVLAPGDYLTIFADGKNGNFSGELHTDFSLSANGEYLGLVMSDGTTVAYDFGTAYPEQYADVDLLVLNLLRPDNIHCDRHVCTEEVIPYLQRVQPKFVILTHFGARMVSDWYPKSSVPRQVKRIRDETGIPTEAAHDGARFNIRKILPEVKSQAGQGPGRNPLV